MFIYRIEKDGVGPYHQLANHPELHEMACRHSRGEQHPSPHEEGLKMETRHRCGFSSLDQMCRWFSHEEQELMYSLGFELKEISVEDVTDLQVGERQIIFIPKES